MKRKIGFLICLALVMLCAAALAENPVASIFVSNKGGPQEYWGYNTKEAVGQTAEITGNGTYKVSVTFTSALKDMEFAYLAIRDGEKKYPGGMIRLSKIAIDGKRITFKKGFTFSSDGETTILSLWDSWEKKIIDEYHQRSYDGDLTLTTALQKSDLVGAKKIEIEFRFKTAPDDNELVRELRKKGMNNTWNVLFLICKEVNAGKYSGTFSDTEVDLMKSKMIAKLKATMSDLSDGRMKIGMVDTVVKKDPITSVSGISENLTYGKNGDLDLFPYVEGRNYNLIVVFAPIRNVDSWLGLGGTYETFGGKKVYSVIINDPLLDYRRYGERVWKKNGISVYPLMSSLVHEILHCVETNSRENGWTGFEVLHNHEKNGYFDGEYNFVPWFYDLMRDTISTGKPGFRPSSYYISHSVIGSR